VGKVFSRCDLGALLFGCLTDMCIACLRFYSVADLMITANSCIKWVNRPLGDCMCYLRGLFMGINGLFGWMKSKHLGESCLKAY
jgi:hypothetical protein